MTDFLGVVRKGWGGEWNKLSADVETALQNARNRSKKKRHGKKKKEGMFSQWRSRGRTIPDD